MAVWYIRTNAKTQAQKAPKTAYLSEKRGFFNFENSSKTSVNPLFRESGRQAVLTFWRLISVNLFVAAIKGRFVGVQAILKIPQYKYSPDGETGLKRRLCPYLIKRNLHKKLTVDRASSPGVIRKVHADKNKHRHKSFKILKKLKLFLISNVVNYMLNNV